MMGVLEPSKPIEVLLAGDLNSIPGIITHMKDHDISIKLQETSARTANLTPGMSVGIAVELKGVRYRATGCVISCLDGDLALSVIKQMRERSEPVEPVEESRYPRRSCELMVRFRPVRADGCYSAWRHGMTLDVSAEGMTLLMDPQGGVPQKMQVTFSLDEKAGKTATRAYTDEGTEVLHKDSGHSIKATAHLARSRTEPDGMIRAEIKFVNITPKEKGYLLDFAGRPIV